mmetsp:Transcript_29020/g.54312  ORF Transcript_29020/g.54312 Transcript_29020/m.54312 type:complete len:90 (+) Transcript_29020:264-533(+)
MGALLRSHSLAHVPDTGAYMMHDHRPWHYHRHHDLDHQPPSPSIMHHIVISSPSSSSSSYEADRKQIVSSRPHSSERPKNYAKTEFTGC